MFDPTHVEQGSDQNFDKLIFDALIQPRQTEFNLGVWFGARKGPRPMPCEAIIKKCWKMLQAHDHHRLMVSNTPNST